MRSCGPLLAIFALALAGCGDDSDGRGSAGQSGSASATITIGTLTASDTGAPTTGASASSGDAATGDASTATSQSVDDDGDDGSDASAGPKFDVAKIPDGGAPLPDTGCKKVDLLFVIDDSGSMADEQIHLVQSFPEFVAEMQTQLADAESYHVGVITSDAYPFNVGNCVLPGALVTQTGGTDSSNAVCGPFASGKRFMSEADMLGPKFGCAGQVGTMGAGNEQPMFTLAQALTPAINAPGACNDGFIREDALLVVVLITDEEDDHEVDGCLQDPQSGSPGEPADWFNAVVAAKGGVETNIVTLALVGPQNPACPALDKCSGGIQGAEVATRVLQFTQMFTYGSVGQICAASYKQFFSAAISVIDSACENFMPPG